MCWSGKKQASKTKYVAQTEAPTVDEDARDTDEFQLFTIKSSSSRAITVEVLVEGSPLTMEVDMGAAFSIISQKTKTDLLPQVKVHPSNIVLKTYSDERLGVVGELSVQVSYGQQSKRLKLIVVEGKGPSLQRRNWLKHVQLDWKQISNIAHVKDTECQDIE